MAVSINAQSVTLMQVVYVKEKRKCSLCNEEGHNKRTCPCAPIQPPSPPLQPQLQPPSPPLQPLPFLTPIPSAPMRGKSIGLARAETARNARETKEFVKFLGGLVKIIHDATKV